MTDAAKARRSGCGGEPAPRGRIRWLWSRMRASGPRDPGHQGRGHVAAVHTVEAGSPCALKEAVRSAQLLLGRSGPGTSPVMGVFQAPWPRRAK